MSAHEPPPILLNRYIEEMSGELQLEPLLSRLVELACSLIGADHGVIGLHDERRRVVRTAAVFRMPQRALGAETGAGVGLGGQVLLTAKPVIARYGDLPGFQFPEFADNEVIGMPILWNYALIGVFGIGFEPPQRMPDTALDSLKVFARHAGIAIVNARRYEKARKRTVRFALIARVARCINAGSELTSMLQQTADALHEVLEYPNVDIPLVDANDPNVLVVAVRGGGYKLAISGVDRLSIHQGVMGAAVRERRTQRIDNVYDDPRYVRPPNTHGARAELAVPIMGAGEVLGVVNVEGEQPYDELDQLTLEIIADHLGVAILNARLHQQNRDAAVWQERLRLRRELHDSVTQILSSISLLAQALPSAWQRSPNDGTAAAARLAELAQTAFAEMRALLRDLEPDAKTTGDPCSQRVRSGIETMRHAGLVPALVRLLEAMIPAGMARRYHFDLYRTQDLAHEETLYRVCQEAVSNAIRHSGADALVVEARVDDQRVWLRVADDGGGLPINMRAGIGLKSMKERLARLGGELELRAGSPRGVDLWACLPRKDRNIERP